MTSYNETINELEKQVNDFFKNIKPEDLNIIKKEELNIKGYDYKIKDNFISKKNFENMKYIIVISIFIFCIIIFIKPFFIMTEKIVNGQKIKKINYMNLIIITIIFSLIIYFILKKKISLIKYK